MSRIIAVRDLGSRWVDGVLVRVEETIWSGEDSPLYDVYRSYDDECLSEESFTEPPSDGEIRDLIIMSQHEHHAAPEPGCSSCEAVDPGTWRELYAERFPE